MTTERRQIYLPFIIFHLFQSRVLNKIVGVNLKSFLLLKKTSEFLPRSVTAQNGGQS